MNSDTFFVKNKSQTVLFHITWLLLVSCFYGAAFLIPLPPQFRREGIFLADEFIVLVFVALVFFTYGLKGWGAKYVSLTMVLIVFTLPLLRLWETAESTWNIVLGLLPWGDAVSYYLDAHQLIEGNLFSIFSGRRPLYASLLAVLLKLTDQNLQLVLIVFAIINGLAVFLFSEEVRKEFGPVSAIIALYLSQFFYRPFVGTALTEQFGFPIGLLGLVVLLRAVKNAGRWLFALGLMLITFALLIRAGAFFVLPLFIMFGVFSFAGNRRQYLKHFLFFTLAVAVPIAVNTWLGRQVAIPNAVPFGNFAETLYGQARGGLRWTQATNEHPELASMLEPYRSRELYRLAFEEIRNNPFGLVKGSVKAWADFIVPGPLSAFGFLNLGNKTVDFFFQLAASLLFIVGLWLIWKDRKNPVRALLLVYWTGTFISIPFLPPIDAGIRPYTASIASVFLPIIFVFSLPFFRHASNTQSTYQAIPMAVPYGLASALLLVSIVGAPLLVFTTNPLIASSAVCAPELIPINIKLTHGSYISLTSVDSEQNTDVPVVSIGDVHRSFDDFAYGDFASVLRKIKQPALVTVVNDLSMGNSVWVVAPPEVRNYEGKIISACAELIFPKYAVMVIQTVNNP